ncbi:MAG: hypothetical protein H6742_02420 [Alphaproteobacteria bacterium]|nr:hypothetical protein [Alphaproteobacteria bacterium]
MPRLLRPPPVLLLGLPLALVGCGNNGLAQAWQLDRLRILGVRATPAEPRPGEAVSFEALYYLPGDDELELSVWIACLPEGADDFGCQVDPELLGELTSGGVEDLTPDEQAALFEDLVDAGLVGAEPFVPPVWVTPLDALDGLDDQERLEGVSAVVNITAIPKGATTQDDIELAYKRLPISEATTPNHNPELTGFVVDGVEVAPGSTIPWTWGRDLDIIPVLPDDSIETYTYTADDGTVEERVEEQFITWYTEAGSFDQEYSLYPTVDVVWSPPAPPGLWSLWPGADASQEVEIIGVVRDRRGGMAWGSLTVALATADQVAPLSSDTGSGDDAGASDTGSGADAGASDTGSR